MYKVFVNNKPIILSDQINTETQYEFYTFSQLQIPEILHRLRNTNTKGVYIYHENLEVLWHKFKASFVVVKAAGGAVIKEDAILLIFRNGFWDLPKGKMEKGETIQATALREVEEECGVQKLKVTKELPTSYHVFYENNQYKLKITYWFTMKTEDFSTPIPQKEEGISKATYVPINKVSERYSNMYSSIRELISKNIENNKEQNI